VAGPLREDALLAGYFFHGEEEYLADEFIDELRRLLSAAAGGEFHLTRMDLDEAKWPEIVDAARTAPFLFEPWRAIVVRVPDKKAGPARGGGPASGAEGDEGRGSRLLSALDQKVLKAYFADPPSSTVVVVVRAGRYRKDDPVVRFFSSLPKAAVSVAEMKRLYPAELMRRADEKARSLGKTVTEGAKRRLFELVGQDLRLMINEVAKLAVFVGDKKGIEEDDVSRATAGQRSFESYELDDALAAADFARAAAILGDLFAEGERPEQIVGRLAGFFRNVLAAQTWLGEKSRTRDEVFQAFFPKIQKGWSFYADKSRQFFGVVDGLSPAELAALLRKLRKVDQRLKSTDLDPRTLLEVFVAEYCLARTKRKVISPEWG
jgi:DNA polymerase III subunit delta